MNAPLGAWPGIHALRSPDRVALIDGDTGRVRDYRELDERTSRVAAFLRSEGVQPGDRVALLTLNSPEMLEIILGIAKVGAISVPVNIRLAAPEVAFILSDCGAELLFASTVLGDTARAAADGTQVRRIVTVGMAAERASGAGGEFEDLVAGASAPGAAVAGGASAGDVAERSLEDVAMIMYTSGTTGRPKGAMLTHGNTLWNAVQHNSMDNGLRSSDINLATAPLFHIGALGVYTLPLLYWGGTSIITETFDPAQWARLIGEHQVTKAFAVPAMWQAIVGSGVLDGADLSSLQTAISGGAPCPLVVIEALRGRGVAFTEGFGMTETAPLASALANADVTERAGTVGRPAPHIEYRIVDASDDEVPIGEVGELTIRGPNVFVGYWNRPEATEEAFRGGWFHSGDMARVDEDGFYTLVDRKKDMVISGGENVYPIEVEQVLYRHPAVLEVSVIGLPDERWGEAVTAIVVTKEDAQPSPGPELEAELTAFARERIGGFKVPKSYRFVPELPKTATGKIRKNVLREEHTGQSGQVQR